MGLQAILEKIRASGDAQIQEIEKNTRSQVNGVMAQAQMEARQIQEDARESASAPAVAERARILHRARLESLRILGDVREDLVDTAMTRTRERLAARRNDESYPSVLRMMIQEALAGLNSGGTGNVQLIADPRDRAMLENMLADLKLDLCVGYELKGWGGLVAKSEDGRVVIINTFESRLEHATAFLRSHLATLFEADRSILEEDVVHG
jgi:vacuolar-type H+-ATPase subunit E/Vma4